VNLPPSFISLSDAASAYVEARQAQDLAQHMHRIRMLSRSPESVIGMAAQEWNSATAVVNAKYYDLARCVAVAAAAIKAANVPQPATSLLPLVVDMAQHCRQSELNRQFERSGK
jgi:hypothetical protein